MTQDIEPFKWSNYSQSEWLICITEFEKAIFKMVLHEQATVSLLMNLSRAADPNLNIRSDLHSNAIDHWTKLCLNEDADFNIRRNLESTEYFSASKLDDGTELISRLKPAIIYSERMMICFDPLVGMIIYIFVDEGIMQYANISITLLSLVLFAMCKVANVKILDFSTIEYDNGNPIQLGLQIFTTISKCIGYNEPLSYSQCIIHPINNPYYLRWGRYGFAVMTHITHMVCSQLRRMLFYDERIIEALTQSEQPLLNRFQILAFAPVKSHDFQKQRWIDIHVVLTFSEPCISKTLCFSKSMDKHDKISTHTLALLSKVKELPIELQLKILGQPEDFNNYLCNCLSADDTLHKCLNGEPIRYQPKDRRVSLLFPISIRKRVNPLQSTSTDVYIVIRTQPNRELKYNVHSKMNNLAITNDEKDRQESIKFIDRHHFKRTTYNMNNKILGALASGQDERTSNYNYDSNREARDNPFFRTDSQFQQIDTRCGHVV